MAYHCKLNNCRYIILLIVVSITSLSVYIFIFSSGEFQGGGSIAVECSPFQVAHVDTKGRFGKVDGRWPHWVTEYEGTRYSLIYVSYDLNYCFV